MCLDLLWSSLFQINFYLFYYSGVRLGNCGVAGRAMVATPSEHIREVDKARLCGSSLPTVPVKSR